MSHSINSMEIFLIVTLNIKLAIIYIDLPSECQLALARVCRFVTIIDPFPDFYFIWLGVTEVRLQLMLREAKTTIFDLISCLNLWSHAM